MVVSTAPAGIAVPQGALFRDGDHWIVFRVENGRAQTTRVQLGGRNDRDVLVVEGLQTGDRVILYPGDHIKNGILVK
ncbi:MAG: hypothetical protein IPN19_00345 [Elusimicrobia bacterium]|nr:hypothetical protein [Elusimicrobiota bacterium]